MASSGLADQPLGYDSPIADFGEPRSMPDQVADDQK
jgi:hypothetical protein